MIILVEDSLGWQNRLIDKASVQFRLTTKYKDTISQKDAVSFFIAMKGDERLAAKKNPLADEAYELYKNGMKRRWHNGD